MRDYVARLRELLQLRGGHAGNRDAVIMPEGDHCVAVRVGGDQRLQLLHGLRVGKVVKLDGVVLGIEVDDGVGSNAGLEHEIVIAGSADRHRHGLVHIHGRVLRVSESDAVGLGQSLTRCEVYLVAAEIEFKPERNGTVALGYRIEREGAEIVGAVRGEVRAEGIRGI